LSNPLSGLKIDHWWHAFTVVGGAGTIASIALTSPAIPQRDLILLFLSLFLFGVGQWINHPIQMGFHPMGTLTSYPRKTYFTVFALEIAAVVIFSIGVFRIMRS